MLTHEGRTKTESKRSLARLRLHKNEIFTHITSKRWIFYWSINTYRESAKARKTFTFFKNNFSPKRPGKLRPILNLKN